MAVPMISYDVAMVTVQEVLRYNTGKDREFAPSEVLEDLGLDSLDLVEISIDLEDAFMFNVDTADLRWLKTVDDVVNLVVRQGRCSP